MQTIGTFSTHQLVGAIPYRQMLAQRAHEALAKLEAKQSEKAAKKEAKLAQIRQGLPQAGGLRLIGLTELREKLSMSKAENQQTSQAEKRVVPISKGSNGYSATIQDAAIYTTKADCLRAMSAAGFTHFQMDGKVAIIPKVYRKG